MNKTINIPDIFHLWVERLGLTMFVIDIELRQLNILITGNKSKYTFSCQ